MSDPLDLARSHLEAGNYLRPKPGRLVLFPAYMRRGAVPFTEEKRLTIAFDAVPA